MSDLINTLNNMKAKFNAEAAQGMNEIFQFNLDEGEQFHVFINNSECSVEDGVHSNPSVSLNMPTSTLVELMNGSLDGIQAFMQGKLKATGNIMLAAKLGELFPV